MYKKGTGHRYIELFKSLQIINDSLYLISIGKRYQTIPIAGQLRALLLKDKQTPNPLFFEILELLNKEISVYLKIDKNKTQIGNNLFYWNNSIDISLKETQEYSLKVSFEDWLEKIVFEYDTESYSIGKIIKLIANKNGGAHYNYEVPICVAVICAATDSNYIPFVDKVIVHVAETIKTIGLELIRYTFNFHYIAKIAIKYDTLDSHKNIISYFDETCVYMPICLVLHSNSDLLLKITDPDRRYFIAPIKKGIKSGIYIVNFSYEIDDNFNSILRIYSSHDDVKEYVLIVPIYVYNLFVRYPHQWISDENITVGLYELKVFDRVLSKDEYRRVINSVKVDKDTNMVIFDGRHYMTVDKNHSLVLDSAYCGTFDEINQLK